MNPRLLAGITGALAAITLTVVFTGGDAGAADRVVTDSRGSVKYLSASATVKRVLLKTLGDGGCEVTADGMAPREDGGTPYRSTRVAELGGTPLTECLDMRSDALAFWKTNEGLNSDRIETDGLGTRVYLSASSAVESIELTLLADGGCQAEIAACAPKQDGGAPYCTDPDKELAGANRTKCLAVLSRAKTLWRNAEGL